DCLLLALRHELPEQRFARHHAKNEEEEEEHQEYREQRFRDSGRASRDVGEAESCGDERNEKEQQGPAQHHARPSCIGANRSASRPGALISTAWPSRMAMLAAAAVASKAASLVA